MCDDVPPSTRASHREVRDQAPTPDPRPDPRPRTPVDFIFGERRKTEGLTGEPDGRDCSRARGDDPLRPRQLPHQSSKRHL